MVTVFFGKEFFFGNENGNSFFSKIMNILEYSI